MLYIKQRIPTTTYQEVITELPMINKYFWQSRSVYAVEFKENVFTTEEGNVYHEIVCIEAKFEENIILCESAKFCKKYPLSKDFCEISLWVKYLMEAYITNNMSSRTKSQFDADFNLVIKNLQSIRT